ncbi:MAG: DegT/DnrJ/EryC1/StrS family aminotransferase [Desulfobulbaceae bacterium]|nr:DegT/DnrJ/EryC1/StrS family aminotransferase [Desulfobulbaceae bacterium]
MNVPLLDLKPQLDELREEIIEKVIEVIDSTRYIQGPEVDALEAEVADYCGGAHAIGVSSGTDALLVALMALDIGPGDQVLTTPFSFFATMGVILRLGARPAFVDIDPVSFNIDPNQLEIALAQDRDRRIKAVIPVHLYGQCAEMTKIVSLCEHYRVPLVEDAAQAIGAEVPFSRPGSSPAWRRAGTLGIAGCFSFFPSKNLGGIGDGGMVISQDPDMAAKIRLLRNHGAHPKYYHALVGGNFRLDPIQAAVLRVKLPHLDVWHAQRRENAHRYDELFTASGLLGNGRISLPRAVFADQATKQTKEVNYHIYNQYVIRVQERDAMRIWLQDSGVTTEIYYPLGLHQQQCLQPISSSVPMPHTEQAALETLALPIFPGLTEEMQHHVVQTIQAFYG